MIERIFDRNKLVFFDGTIVNGPDCPNIGADTIIGSALYSMFDLEIGQKGYVDLVQAQIPSLVESGNGPDGPRTPGRGSGFVGF